MGSLLRRWGFTVRGWFSNRRGEWWLLGQLLLIAAMALPPAAVARLQGWPWWVRLLGATTLMTGAVLALQSFRDLGASLTPLPDPMPGVPLVTEGAYRRCRHPLYQALLLAALGLTLLLGSLQHLLLSGLLAAVLAGKAHREERRLLERHPAYAGYMASTVAIIPGLPGLDWRCPGPP
jgi:protein-S-isoprenylcysteine O-methyltransferase Ste14